ncbi:hypothetical protein [Pseudactinotalea sp. HY158]|uniref:hypothetical protein n=1 Tax=Pseudactinotalea sp. HY158 TaxID=2654547 RepID=UPI00129C95C2|nr:hypothetical protein [Pseudactinotalea sp. HY158]QGH70368.1 hypothetical protein GCE65_13365 [Pseudactinotalea sp. HY158]
MPGHDGHRTPEQARRRRQVTVSVIVVVLAAAAAAYLSFQSTRSPQSAFASWTPQPEPVLSQDALAAAHECAAGGDRGGVTPSSIPIAEQRGSVLFLLVEYPAGLDLCLGPEGEVLAAGGFSRDAPPASLEPREVATLVLHTGGTGEDTLTTLVGRVGEKVTGIEIHERGPDLDPDALDEPPETINATVEHGFYAAWWPGVTPDDATIDLTVHMSDGAVAEVTAFSP